MISTPQYSDMITEKLRQLHHNHRRYSRTEFEELCIYRGQPPLLLLLANSVEMTQKEIAEKLELTPPTINKMIRRLELNELIVKKKDLRDHRITRINLSKKGLSLINKVKEIVDREEDLLSSVFNQQEKATLLEMLSRMEGAYKLEDEHGRKRL